MVTLVAFEGSRCSKLGVGGQKQGRGERKRWTSWRTWADPLSLELGHLLEQYSSQALLFPARTLLFLRCNSKHASADVKAVR